MHSDVDDDGDYDDDDDDDDEYHGRRKHVREGIGRVAQIAEHKEQCKYDEDGINEVNLIKWGSYEGAFDKAKGSYGR